MNSRVAASSSLTSILIFLQSSISVSSFLLHALIFLLYQAFEGLKHALSMNSSNFFEYFQIFFVCPEVSIFLFFHVRIVSFCVQSVKEEEKGMHFSYVCTHVKG